MQYEFGKQYEMNVIDIRKDAAGFNYIAVYDDDPQKEFKVYNILKCQYENLPRSLFVVVKSIDAFGKIRFKQDEARLIKQHYEPGKRYSFQVSDVKEDFNTKAPYYIVEDDFGDHHYYFQGKQQHEIGDNCILEIEGFTEKGFLKFKEVETADEINLAQPVTEDVGDDTDTKLISLWNSLPVLEGLEESETLELKSSITFPPGCNGKPDIDKQLYNILKELTAFMNTKGGTLLIGVHDKTKKIIGIEGDLHHLNDGEDDFAGSYNENTDGYQLKIRNAVDKLCPSVANSLMDIEFPEVDGNVYCKIIVKPSRRPVFLSGTQLFIRQGNRLKLLKGDAITFFVTERMTISIKDVIDTGGVSINTPGIDLDVMKQAMRELLNERRAIPTDLPRPRSLSEVDYWLIWYSDASWKRSRSKSDEQNVYFQIPVYKAMSDPLVVFCYATGRVSTMKLADFRRGANLNIVQKNGWKKDGDKPMSVFIMHPTDFLVGYSVDHNGTQCVKLHAITDYPPTNKGATNIGAPFLPDGWRIKLFAPLGAEHKNKVAHLVVKKNKRTLDAGTTLSSVSLKDEIEYVEEVLMKKNSSLNPE